MSVEVTEIKKENFNETINRELYLRSSVRHPAVRGWLIILLILGAFIYLGGALWGPALLDDADSVHAEAAREMARSGDFITLHADGIRYLDKAPCLYWPMA